MKVWFENMYMPKCFDSEKQFKDWHRLMIQSKAPVYSTWVCVDCLPDYQQKMKKQGRCENPHVRFKKEYEERPNGEIRDMDWYVIGYVPEYAYKKAVNMREAQKSKFWQQLKQLKLVE